jgi:hypothetical protein
VKVAIPAYNKLDPKISRSLISKLVPLIALNVEIPVNTQSEPITSLTVAIPVLTKLTFLIVLIVDTPE